MKININASLVLADLPIWNTQIMYPMLNRKLGKSKAQWDVPNICVLNFAIMVWEIWLLR
jgi:hypothetical protein